MKLSFKIIYVFVLFTLVVNIGTVLYQLFTTGKFDMAYSAAAIMDLVILAASNYMINSYEE